eukprot:TRINITY_DN27118_c0_g1_i1.p1 TRINITY_DN27118_c0_g1~~TRINITY_DN27118_c0_g1_i1.p1  ORF type:complete len:452 (+),score=103.77 TRINITY_DN27118_c0_g1_i1:99-1358(+)
MDASEKPPALPSENLYIQGLPLELDENLLRSIFQQYGTVTQCKLLDPVPGKADRVALMRMGTVEEATWIVANVHNNIPNGMATPVSVQFSLNKAQREVDARKAAGVPPPQQGFAQTGVAVPPPAAYGAPVAPPAAYGAAVAPDAAYGAAVAPAAAYGAAVAPAAAYGAAVAPAAAYAAPAPPGGLQLGVMLSGTVKRWDAAKGFGFIVPNGGGPDVFVHAKELQDGEVLLNGAQVMFEATLDTTKGAGKYRAKGVIGATSKEVSATNAISDKLFITGLPAEVTEEQITALFNQYGAVASVKKLLTPGKLDSAALVRMSDQSQAKWLVDNVHQNIPAGLSTPVNITYAENKGGPPAGTGVCVPPPAQLGSSDAGAYGKVMPGAQDLGVAAGPYGAGAGIPQVAAVPGMMAAGGLAAQPTY